MATPYTYNVEDIPRLEAEAKRTEAFYQDLWDRREEREYTKSPQFYSAKDRRIISLLKEGYTVRDFHGCLLVNGFVVTAIHSNRCRFVGSNAWFGFESISEFRHFQKAD